MRRTAEYTRTDYKTNTQIAKELKITPILDKLLEYKRKLIQHANRMSRNRLPRVMKHYSPTGRRNHGRPLTRLLDTWDRNGSISGPTPWQTHDDDDDDDDDPVFILPAGRNTQRDTDIGIFCTHTRQSTTHGRSRVKTRMDQSYIPWWGQKQLVTTYSKLVTYWRSARELKNTPMYTRFCEYQLLSVCCFISLGWLPGAWIL